MTDFTGDSKQKGGQIFMATEEIARELHDINTKLNGMTVSQTSFDGLCSDVRSLKESAQITSDNQKKIIDTVYGNGKVGLTTRVDRLEHTIRGLMWPILVFVGAVIVALAGVIINLTFHIK